MVDFICLMLAFFGLVYFVVERLIYGISVDSIELDRKYLWNHYPHTLEDMRIK